MQFKQHALGLCAALIAATSLISCSKDKDDPAPAASYPKTVTIEYKVTSSDIQKCDIYYVNESGGNAIVDDAALPFSKKITRTVNRMDHATVDVTAIGSGSVKGEILVNNEVVATKTFSGTGSAFGGSTVHVFQ